MAEASDGESAVAKPLHRSAVTVADERAGAVAGEWPALCLGAFDAVDAERPLDCAAPEARTGDAATLRAGMLEPARGAMARAGWELPLRAADVVPADVVGRRADVVLGVRVAPLVVAEAAGAALGAGTIAAAGASATGTGAGSATGAGAACVDRA